MHREGRCLHVGPLSGGQTLPEMSVLPATVGDDFVVAQLGVAGSLAAVAIA